MHSHIQSGLESADSGSYHSFLGGILHRWVPGPSPGYTESEFQDLYLLKSFPDDLLSTARLPTNRIGMGCLAAIVAERDVNAEEVFSKWLLGNNRATRKSQNVAPYQTHTFTKYVTPHKSLTFCELRCFCLHSWASLGLIQ